MRNLGLSGMMSLKTTAEVRAGKEQRTTNNLQLLKSSDPRKKCVLVLGITIQARPGHHTCLLPSWVVYLTRSTMTSVDVDIIPLTCSQDVSCHPECSQSTDHCTPALSGHELREVGEDNRDGPSDPTKQDMNIYPQQICSFYYNRPRVTPMRTQ